MTLPKRIANTKPVWQLPGARVEVLRRVADALQQSESDSADCLARLADSTVSA